MFGHTVIFIVSICLTGSLAHPPLESREHLVDLGYARHVPTWTNVTSAGTELLNYNNIRYAEPPLGWKRFRKPQQPPPYQHGIQDGNISSWKTDCVSSAHAGVPFPLLNGTTWGSEDCLFLNVITPKNAKPGDKLPVLHWVVGSAFAFGGKDWTGFGINTYGLYNQPLNLTDQFIIVTHNYRLGVPGWLPKLEDDMNGNLGVWDTLAATQWTKKHIAKFGGDPENITVIGQSAGAAIITWLLLGEDGNLDLPFDQAWIASPAVPPRKEIERSRPIYDMIMNHTGCETIDCLRHVSQKSMLDVNQFILNEQWPGAGGGSLGPGVGLTPTVDGELLNDLPAAVFEAGKFNKQVKQVVAGSTALEGLGLSSDRDMPNRFSEVVRANIPNASDKTIEELLELYPFPPELPQYLAWSFTTDIVYRCTSSNIAKAYADRARHFIFSIPPATHGLDISYFFFGDNTTTPVSSIDAAYASESTLLQYIFRRDFPVNNFAPYARPISEWKHVADNDTIVNITTAGFEFGIQNGLMKARCAYINSLLIDPANGV